MKTSKDELNDDNHDPFQNEEITKHKFFQSFMRFLLTPHRDWNALAQNVKWEIKLLDYGAPEQTTTPLLQRRAVVHTIGPLSLNDFTKNDMLVWHCAKLKTYLKEIKSWGLSLRWMQLPDDLEDLTKMADGILSGPFGKAERDDLENFLTRLLDVVWAGLQCEALVNDELWSISGRHGYQWSKSYLMAFVNKDIEFGKSEGTSLADDDATLRSGYLELARQCKTRGDLERAASYSLIALHTLLLDSETSSGPGFTTHFPVLQISPEASIYFSEDTHDHYKALINEITTEFQDCSKAWITLEVRRINAVARLSRRASEGVAVWRELYLYGLEEKGHIHSLFGKKHSQISAEQERQRYMHMDITSDYRLGLEQAESVEQRLGYWFLESAHIGSAVIFDPLEMIAKRVPVEIVESIPRNSLWAPNARLEKLATFEIKQKELSVINARLERLGIFDTKQKELSAILTAIHQYLDSKLPGIAHYSHSCLVAEQEKKI
jgi:hypothetical protein